ncbi:MAG: hypothetical protein ACPG4Z_02415 [Chitinophagales bacterium]
MKTKLIYSILFFWMMISCSKDGNNDIGNLSENGTGGSTARFVLVDNFLYVIDNTKLRTYNVSDDANPILVNTDDVGFGIETLYPFEDYLLIGSTTGMFIYEIQGNGVPSYISEYQHIETCDPVVASGDYAYVTLRSTRSCGGNFSENNQLQVINIQNPQSPNLVYQTWVDNPKGLAVDDNFLFVCVAEEGIFIYDITDGAYPVYYGAIDGFTANDVIAQNNRLLVVCPDGLRQFEYSNINNISTISYFAVNL